MELVVQDPGEMGGILNVQKPLPQVSSSSPSSLAPIESFSQRFSRFLCAETAVKHLWELAFEEGKQDFPRHFYSLCSLSPKTQQLGFLSVTPTPLTRPTVALENYCSFFLHTTCHSYLHSSIGTFVQVLEQTLFNPSLPSPLSEVAPSQLEELFSEFMDLLFFSSFEVVGIIAPVFRDVFSSSNVASPKEETALFLELYFSSFICSCLEQPQIIFNTPLSKKTVALCMLLASILRDSCSRKFMKEEEKEVEEDQHFLYELRVGAREQAEKITDFILRGIGKKEVDMGYCKYFSPLWEKYHLPCTRKGHKKSTCSMYEPTRCESLMYFCEYVVLKKEALENHVVEEMGAWSLEAEVVREFFEWARKKENMEQIKSHYSTPIPKSPKFRVSSLSLSSSFSLSSS